MTAELPDAAANIAADLTGSYYFDVLAQLHASLKPKSYFEVGVNAGSSFRLSTCPSIGVDPGFVIADPETIHAVLQKPFSMFFNMPSDDFFARWSPTQLLGGPIDFAFLDGMHRCEYLLRDFINTEAHCKPNSIIALHDCLPTDVGMTGRVAGELRSPLAHRWDWWTGDVWRTSLLLKRLRPDLRMTVVDASPTGLVLVTNLDPGSCALRRGYAGHVEQMLGWSLDEIGIAGLFAELEVQPTSAVASHHQLTARFWL